MIAEALGIRQMRTYNLENRRMLRWRFGHLIRSIAIGATRRFSAVVLVYILSACGSGDAESPNAAAAPPPVTNTAPSIEGVPETVVTQGQPYTFTPNASDPEGDLLTYSITNQPAWTTFDAATGVLAGTPTDAHVGVTSGVIISVSDGTDSSSLAPFDLEVRPIPLGSATVTWSLPMTNADGSPLSDLAGFRLHYGTASQNYTTIEDIGDAKTTSSMIDELEPGTWYFAVTAIDYAGNESDYSLEVTKEVNP